jgi:signal transduction histidine kinase
LQLSLSELSLPELVKTVVEQRTADTQRSGCRFELDLQEGPLGQWDRARIEQVIDNLLGNATKYGAGKAVHVQVRADGERARLTVRDEGVGIEPEALPKIFDKFERAVSARHFGGLGLGLFIARQIVESHGGTIRAASEPGQGATFIVELPLRR